MVVVKRLELPRRQNIAFEIGNSFHREQDVTMGSIREANVEHLDNSPTLIRTNGRTYFWQGNIILSNGALSSFLQLATGDLLQ